MLSLTEFAKQVNYRPSDNCTNCESSYFLFSDDDWRCLLYEQGDFIVGIQVICDKYKNRYLTDSNIISHYLAKEDITP